MKETKVLSSCIRIKGPLETEEASVHSYRRRRTSCQEKGGGG